MGGIYIQICKSVYSFSMTLDDLLRLYPRLSPDRVWRYVRDGLLRPPTGKGQGRARGRASSDWTEEHVRALVVMLAAQQPDERFNYARAERALIPEGWVRGDVLRRHVTSSMTELLADADMSALDTLSPGVRKVFEYGYSVLPPLVHSALTKMDEITDGELESYNAATTALVPDIIAFAQFMSGLSNTKPLQGIDAFITALRPMPAPARPGRPRNPVTVTLNLPYTAHITVLTLMLLGMVGPGDTRKFIMNCMKKAGLHVAWAVKDVLMKAGEGKVNRVMDEKINEYLSGVR